MAIGKLGRTWQTLGGYSRSTISTEFVNPSAEMPTAMSNFVKPERKQGYYNTNYNTNDHSNILIMITSICLEIK